MEEVDGGDEVKEDEEEDKSRVGRSRMTGDFVDAAVDRKEWG